MSARSENPINLVQGFRSALSGFRPEAVGDAFNRLAGTMIKWHSDFLLHGERGELATFFKSVAEMAEGNKSAPVAGVIRKLAGFVAREGDDQSVMALQAALAPVYTATHERPVLSAAIQGQRMALTAFEGGMV